MPTLSQELIALRKRRAEYDRKRKSAEAAEDVFKKAQARLYERMEAESVQSMKVDGTLFVRSETAYATTQDREAFVEWAENHDSGLIEMKERAALLNQLIREKLDNGEELPPGVGYYVRQVVSQRAA